MLHQPGKFGKMAKITNPGFCLETPCFKAHPTFFKVSEGQGNYLYMYVYIYIVYMKIYIPNINIYMHIICIYIVRTSMYTYDMY